MKKISIVLLCFSGVIASCKKEVPGFVDSNYTFDAALLKDTILLSDTAAFTLTDNPDVIAFYSGEIGNNYEYRERTVLTGGRLKVKFDSRVANRTADTLEVLLSNDFSGVYDSANVAAATWKKITGLFNFPVLATPLGTFIPSGTAATPFADITDSVESGKPMFFAFRYDINKTNNIEWSISKLGMYNVFSNGIPTATVIDSMTNNSGSFAEVKMGEATNRWSKTSTLYKYLNSSSAKLGASHWYISRSMNPNAVSPDLPIVVKNISQSPVTSYRYQYKNPGTYNAVFVASYNRLNFQKTFVKSFTVIVQ